jgi:hypothetical protein
MLKDKIKKKINEKKEKKKLESIRVNSPNPQPGS